MYSGILCNGMRQYMVAGL